MNGRVPMSDKIFFVVLVLNATGLFGFIAPQLGVTIGTVSLALLGINLFYLVIKRKHSMAIFHRSEMRRWLFVLLIWPLLTILYAPSFEIREIGLQLYYFTLFFGAVLYTVANGLPAMHRVMAVSLALTLVGLALNMVAPQYFEAVSNLAEANVLKQGRACGFLLQPNQLAISMGFLFTGWFALWKRKNMYVEVAAIVTFILVMLPTGSRIGMLMAMIIVTFILLHGWKNKLSHTKPLLKTIVLIACLLGGLYGTKYYVVHFGQVDPLKEDLINRIETMLSLRLSDDGNMQNDGSIIARKAGQAVYWSLFSEKPLHGHGFGSNTYYQENGTLFLSAHSSALTCAMMYGGLYPVVFCLLIISLCRRRSCRDKVRLSQSNSVEQFASITVFLFVLASIIDTRTFYIVLGMFFAIVCRPQSISRYDEQKGRIPRIISRHKIVSPSAEMLRWKDMY